MSTATQQVVSKAWNFAHVLRDDGLSYMAYVEQEARQNNLSIRGSERSRNRDHPSFHGTDYSVEPPQITFLLFLKMADEQTKPPYNRKPIVPAGYD